MLRHLQFKIAKKDKKIAYLFLSQHAQAPLYEIVEKNHLIIGGFFNTMPETGPDCPFSFEELPCTINWQEQWEAFSPHIKNHRLELDLTPYGADKTLLLTPGAGFGDLSHPTTQLCLKHMARLCKGRDVIDFGCGSGILSVAAYAFGAKNVISIEIDQGALEHAKNNLKLNGFLCDDVYCFMPHKSLKAPICLINMTFGEQKIALQEMSYFPQDTIFLSSGLLKEQKQAYLLWAKTKHLEFELLDQEGKWLLFKGQFFKD